VQRAKPDFESGWISLRARTVIPTRPLYSFYRAKDFIGVAEVLRLASISLRLLTFSVTNGVEKNRWIIVGFQTNAVAGGNNPNQRFNHALFNNVNLRNIYAMLNGDRYPTIDLHLDFTKCRVTHY